MTATKHVFGNKALQNAANLGVGAFKKSAAPVVAPTLTVPTTLPVAKFPCPDNSFVVENGSDTRFVMQRHGLIFSLTHTPYKTVFNLEQVIDRKGKTAGREMMHAEAQYALAVTEDYLGPQECARLSNALGGLRNSLPGTPHPDTPIKVSGTNYMFTMYGYEYRIGMNPPYPAHVTYRDATTSRFETRTMRADELATSRRVISRSLTLQESVQKQGFLKTLEERQYDLATPSP